MRDRLSQFFRHRLLSGATVSLLLLMIWQVLAAPASGVLLGPRSLQISSGVISTTSIYKLTFDLSTPGQLGSIALQFCANSPNFNDICVTPPGLSVADAVLAEQSGQTGFTISAASDATNLILTRPPAPSTVQTLSYTFENIMNPSVVGSYFVRMLTFASSDASGPNSDYGGVVFAVNNNLSVTAEVPPFLIFCAALTIPTLDCENAEGNYINFGELSSVRPSFGTSQVLSATNAKDGYNVTLTGTTLTSGNNEITPITAADVSRPGTAQFGLNLRANNSPSGGTEPVGPGVGAPAGSYGSANFYQFKPGDTIISTTRPDDVRRYTASYLVNVPRTQAPGVYVSTVTYICLGNF